MIQSNRNSILLESGTNEVEIVEFSIQDTVLGINVIKVREIITPILPIRIPLSHPCLEGIIHLRGNVIPVIDLGKFLGIPPSETPREDKFIITEFNQSRFAFHVHDVKRIHRISWAQIEKPSDIVQHEKNCVSGVVKIEDTMVLLLDFESIIVEISPALGDQSQSVQTLGERSISSKKLIIAEDSPTLRQILRDYLPKIGYPNLTFFQSGQEAWEFIERLADTLGENINQQVDLVITDIEMPQMDGHSLTKKIKTHPVLQKIPVIIFSSLITDNLRHKGAAVGADEQISKPQYMELSHIIDRLVNK